MFVDTVEIKLFAGRGGNGVVAWRREKYLSKGGPYGGNGGKGGSIIFKCDSSLRSLEHFRNKRIIKAEYGASGSTNNRQGRQGRDLILKIPPGTLLKKEQEILFDFTHDEQEYTICLGGKGGKGNTFFKSPTNQAPTKFTPGLHGEMCDVTLELKLIADIGLVGMPNAGKSTLLSSLGQIDTKIGAYPFTTLEPNLATIEFDDYTRLTIADIPGIIEGAHNNRGLGLAFLKHIERTRLLLFVIDISDYNTRNPLEDFYTLQKELRSHSPQILDKPYFIALNKIDLLETSETIETFQKEFSSPIFCLSAIKRQGVKELLTAFKQHALIVDLVP